MRSAELLIVHINPAKIMLGGEASGLIVTSIQSLKNNFIVWPGNIHVPDETNEGWRLRVTAL